MFRKSIILITCCMSFSVHSSVMPHPGKTLHDEAHCMRCHAKIGYNTQHTTKRKIGSIKDLKKAVTFCNNQLNTGWFDDEINEVVQYLNKTYYKLPN